MGGPLVLSLSFNASESACVRFLHFSSGFLEYFCIVLFFPRAVATQSAEDVLDPLGKRGVLVTNKEQANNSGVLSAGFVELSVTFCDLFEGPPKTGTGFPSVSF